MVILNAPFVPGGWQRYVVWWNRQPPANIWSDTQRGRRGKEPVDLGLLVWPCGSTPALAGERSTRHPGGEAVETSQLESPAPRKTPLASISPSKGRVSLLRPSGTLGLGSHPPQSHDNGLVLGVFCRLPETAMPRDIDSSRRAPVHNLAALEPSLGQGRQAMAFVWALMGKKSSKRISPTRPSRHTNPNTTTTTPTTVPTRRTFCNLCTFRRWNQRRPQTLRQKENTARGTTGIPSKERSANRRATKAPAKRECLE